MKDRAKWWVVSTTLRPNIAYQSKGGMESSKEYNHSQKRSVKADFCCRESEGEAKGMYCYALYT